MNGSPVRWWTDLGACPMCGHAVSGSQQERRSCPQCRKSWSDRGSIRVWREDEAGAEERHLPHEWSAGRNSTGGARAAFLAKRAVWNVLKGVGLPLRAQMQREVGAFEQRSQTDAALAHSWRDHYLKGLSVPRQAVWFEHSYRKIEKIAFARLLEHRIIVQDIRVQPYWAAFDQAWCQVVPPLAPHFPLQAGVADVAFTDGAIFDVEASDLIRLFGEFGRVLKPGGVLIIWAGNSLARSRAMSEVRWHGRIHSLDQVRQAASASGLVEIDHWFEGFAPPFLPTAINMARHALAPWPFKTFDNDSWLARWQQPHHRAYWLLRLTKPATLGATP